MTGSEKLTGRQVKAVQFLLEGNTIQKTAELSGVTERTVYRWLEMPLFTGEIRQAEQAVLERANRRLLSLSEKALEYLEQVLSSPAERGSNVRLRAVSITLDNLVKVREYFDLEQRIYQLEQAVKK